MAKQDSQPVVLTMGHSTRPLVEFMALLVQRPRKSTAQVLAYLNEMNCRRILPRVFRDGSDIVAAWVLPVETMDDRQFLQLCDGFCELADDMSQFMVTEIGGRTPNRIAEPKGEETVDA